MGNNNGHNTVTAMIIINNYILIKTPIRAWEY